MADVNVWLALLVLRHEHHRRALKWFEGLAAGEAGLCRMVQLALVRLLANPSVMGDDALTASAAWQVTGRLLDDERVEFLPEPETLDHFMPGFLTSRTPTGKLVMDAYLAAFALTASRRLVSIDGGFGQFRGVTVELLGR